MPLDVTAGPPLAVVGSGPPGLAAGPPEAGLLPGSVAGPPFAALLAQQIPQAQAATPVSALKSASIVSETTKETDKPKEDDADATDSQSAAVPNPLDAATMIDWTALAAMQAPPPMPAQPASLSTETAVSSAPTNNNEVMDTASAAVPAAIPAQTAGIGRELLPLPVVSQTPAGLAPVRAASDAAPDAAPARLLPDEIVASEMSSEPAVPVASAAFSANASPASVAAPDVAVLGLPEPSPVSAIDVPVGAPQVPQGSAVPITGAVLAPPPVVPSSVAQAVAATAATSAKPTRGTPGARPVPSSPTSVSREQPNSTPRLAAPNAPAVPLTAADVLSPPLLLVPQNGQEEKSAPDTLQNDGTPANNTGRTASSGTAAVPGSNTTAPAGETGDGHPATVTSSTTPVFSPEKAVQKLSISRSSRPKESDDAEEADPSPPSTQETGLHSVNETDTAMLTALPTSLAAAPQETTIGTAPKSLTGAERAQVMQQMADGVATIKPQVIAHGQGQMTLDLHPKEWGDLRVTIKLAQGQTEDGLKQTTVTAHVVAGSPAVKAALETHTTELNRALHETGFRLDRLTVTVQAASADNLSNGDQGSGQQPSDRWQAAQPQTSAENSGIGSGGSSSFAAFSERQGGNAFQSQALSRPSSRNADESDTGVVPVSNRVSGINAGFDRRA